MTELSAEDVPLREAHTVGDNALTTLGGKNKSNKPFLSADKNSVQLFCLKRAVEKPKIIVELIQ